MRPELRRPDLDVVARMLEALLRRGGACGKARFQAAAGLNYDTYLRYLAWLEAKDLVRVMEGKDGPEVRLAPKGLELYHVLADRLRHLLGDGFR
jgi:predicted transcriptional regulator